MPITIVRKRRRHSQHNETNQRELCLLFQDRYKSEKIEDDNYLLMVTRYIHRNTVKAGIVKKQKNINGVVLKRI